MFLISKELSVSNHISPRVRLYGPGEVDSIARRARQLSCDPPA